MVGKRWWAACGGALLMLAACGGPAAAPTASVSVAYAGSLGPVMDLSVGPAFQRATRITYHGRGAGSFGLAREIAAHAIAADVFYSIGTKPIDDLGARPTWAACFASAPLVVVYSPKSRFAPALAAIAQGRQPIQSLFSVMAQPGFKLGRTNPATDPQGQAFYLMVMLAQKLYHLPASTAATVLGAPDNPRQVLSETSVVTQVQAGTIDAASAFLPEAKSRHLPYVTLPPALDFANPADQALYGQVHKTFPTVGRVTGHALRVCATIPPGAHTKVGTRFLAYSLAGPARAYWTRLGYEWGPPAYVGPASAVPASVKRALSS